MNYMTHHIMLLCLKNTVFNLPEHIAEIEISPRLLAVVYGFDEKSLFY